MQDEFFGGVFSYKTPNTDPTVVICVLHINVLRIKCQKLSTSLLQLTSQWSQVDGQGCGVGIIWCCPKRQEDLVLLQHHGWQVKCNHGGLSGIWDDKVAATAIKSWHDISIKPVCNSTGSKWIIGIASIQLKQNTVREETNVSSS